MKILLRFDDIAENMNWRLLNKCEKLFDEYKIKPVLGVIPNNMDEELLSFPRKEDFWQKVRLWKSKGWEISMHGFNHLYDMDTNKNDLFKYGGKSEFFGHSKQRQKEKLEAGLGIFKKNGVKIRSFFAPNHTYDYNTLKALDKSGIRIVIDGYGLFPYSKFNLFFIPQLFYKEIFLPFGIQSTQIHLNYWDDDYYKGFNNFIEKNYKKITNIDYILSLNKNNLFQNSINYSVEKTLKVLRRLR